MKSKLFENVGGNKFKLLNESVSPDRISSIRAGLKKVFLNGGNQLSYDKIQNFGMGFIKDVSEARKCALQEARDMAKGLGFVDHPEKGVFLKEVEWHDEESYKRAQGDTNSIEDDNKFDWEMSKSEKPDDEKREVQIGKEIVKLLKADGQGRGVKGAVITPSPEDCLSIYKLADELIKMHGGK